MNKLSLRLLILLCSLISYNIFAKRYEQVKQDSKGYIPLTKYEKIVDNLLAETTVSEAEQANLPADVSFLFMDLKINPSKDSFKICEFGEGRMADFRFHHSQFGEQAIKVLAPYWDVFWEYAQSLQLPIWFVGKNPTKLIPLECPPEKKFGWKKLIEIGGNFAPSLEALKQDKLFKKYAKKKNIGNKSAINKHLGLIVYKFYNTGNENYYRKIEAFKKEYPQFLVLNAASEPFATNKGFAPSYMINNELSEYKALWGIYPKRHAHLLERNIKRYIPSQKYVLKPLNSNRSSGVIVVEHNQLGNALKKLHSLTVHSNKNKKNSTKKPKKQDKKKKKHKHAKKTRSHPYGSVYRPKQTAGWDYWKQDANKFFLIEEYCDSTLININGKKYDPTVRIFFFLRHDQGKIYTTVLTGYWKFPTYSISEKVDPTDKFKTNPNYENTFFDIPISPKHQAFIKKKVLTMMPTLYEKMLISYQNNFEDIFSLDFVPRTMRGTSILRRKK